MRYQDYINSDAYGCYIILKINKKDVLESMRKGTFWFRHPAFYNCEEDKNGNTTLGDKYDDKLRAILKSEKYLPIGGNDYERTEIPYLS